MPRKITDGAWSEYYNHRALGRSIMESARRTGISYSAALRQERGQTPNSNGAIIKKLRNIDSLPDVVPRDKLNAVARRSLDDFGLFRRRYFGRIATPWQENAAYEMAGFLDSPNKEYVVINCPPGVGKSTTFTHDIPAWLACRNRALRCLIGSRTERQARAYTRRLLRTFERNVPVRADGTQIAKGRALDAEATLMEDFGRFKPANSDVWRAEEFVLAQEGDIAVEDKESSFAAYGMDSGFLGGRYDLVIWDDLVDKRTLKTAEAREALINWWETEAETRVEPGGLLLLQGQRMGADDLYRYALNLKGSQDDDDDPELDAPAKYRHIIYKSHYEDRCQQQHKPSTSLPFPEGCLLDPVRLPWRELATIRANRLDRFEVQYQQQDTDPANALVNPLWINGGRGVDGVEYPGCWDHDRPAGLVLPGLRGGGFPSVLAVDPSPSRYWAITWWIHHPVSDFHNLIDLHREKMEAPEFFHYNAVNGQYSGLLVDWWERSSEQGAPITELVVENNAAQRFMLQDPNIKAYCALRSINIRPHATHRNKADPEYGVQSLGPDYMHGRVRIPGFDGDGTRLRMLKLVHEVTRWPEGSTDDLVMSHWFYRFNLPHIASTTVEPVRVWTPSWMRKSA